MFKLLTEEAKKKVRRDYFVHRITIILYALILVLAFGVIGFLPSYVLSDIRYNEVLVRTRFIDNHAGGSSKSELQKWLKETDRKLKVMIPNLDTDRPSEVVNKILDQRNPGINVTGFSWFKVANKLNLSVMGVARDRQSLITFENSISKSAYFSDVTTPILNLAKDHDIDYQIKFSLAPLIPSTKP